MMHSKRRVNPNMLRDYTLGLLPQDETEQRCVRIKRKQKIVHGTFPGFQDRASRAAARCDDDCCE